MSHKVSTIIPCYNHGSYVQSAVNSVLAQTFNDYEIILINDGSTDESMRVLSDIQARYPQKVVVISQDNKGLSWARQSGLDRAQGDYVIFLDADDQLYPYMMETCLNVFHQSADLSAVVGQTRLIYESDHSKSGILKVGVNTQWPSILEANPFGACCSIMLKKEKVIEAGGVGIPNVKSCEDWDLYIRMIRRKMIFKSVPEILSQYLQHENVLSRNIELMLNEKLAMLDRNYCNGKIPSLLRGEESLEYGKYANCYIIYALGQAVGQQVDIQSLKEILKKTIYGSIDFRYYCNQFLYGMQHSISLSHIKIEPQYLKDVCQLVYERFWSHGWDYERFASMFLREIKREMKAPMKKRSLRRAVSRLLDPLRTYWIIKGI